MSSNNVSTIDFLRVKRALCALDDLCKKYPDRLNKGKHWDIAYLDKLTSDKPHRYPIFTNVISDPKNE